MISQYQPKAENIVLQEMEEKILLDRHWRILRVNFSTKKGEKAVIGRGLQYQPKTENLHIPMGIRNNPLKNENGNFSSENDEKWEILRESTPHCLNLEQ